MVKSEVSNGASTPVRPILKWAGGKRQLLHALRSFYPEEFNRYIEPFVGSGAVFLDLYNTGLLEGREVRLSDINADLVGCYRAVRDGVGDVIDELRRLEAGHQAGGREHYYDVRNERFNPVRREVHASGRPADRYTPALAAMLIYLNRAGFNGLFRVNSQGAFNVPAGRHASLRICDPDNLRRLSTALQTPNLSLEVRPFHDALAEGAAGDFVYLDPPYAPVSRTASFTSYTTAGFGPGQQDALQRAVIDLVRPGRARAAQQFRRAGDQRALRRQRRGAPRRPDGVPGGGAPGDQLLGVRAGAGARIRHHQRRAARDRVQVLTEPELPRRPVRRLPEDLDFAGPRGFARRGLAVLQGRRLGDKLAPDPVAVYTVIS